MPELLHGMLPAGQEPAIRDLAVTLVTAALFGVAVAAIYFLTQRRGRAETASLVATIVLLAVLLAMVTLVIGQNLARAFGLVGVLSIVRFRTVVDDTRDTAFVIYAVVVGMAVGSGFVTLAWVSLPVVGGVAWALSLWGSGRGKRAGRATLVVRLPVGTDHAGVLDPTFAKHLTTSRLTATCTAGKGTLLELTYAARLRPGGSAVALITDLTRVEGAQGIEWKEASGG